MKRIAVLLTVHNRKDKTLNCLRGLMSQSLPKEYVLDVYMTDDGCSDGTPETVKSEFPTINIVRGDGNLFWNRGMYKAWQAASQTYDYDFYLWLNDDTVLLTKALVNLLEEATERPDSVIVGSTHSTIDPTKLTYGGHFKGRHIMPNGYLQPCQTFNGNIVLISKAIFHKIGNLDWAYRHAIGDLDYGWMVTRAGLNNYIPREFRGICDNNPKPPIWIRPEIPLKKRWKNYHSPLGYGQPGPMFHFNHKNFGLMKAVKVWIFNHIRLFFPWLWTTLK